MLKRLLTLVALIGTLAVAGCSCCDSPCYGKSLRRDYRQIGDVVNVYFLNYDKHDPYRCDPCLGD